MLAGCLLAIIADKGELPVSGHGDFVRSFTHAHAGDNFSGGRVHDGHRLVRFVQDQQRRGRSFRRDRGYSRSDANCTKFDKLSWCYFRSNRNLRVIQSCTDIWMPSDPPTICQERVRLLREYRDAATNYAGKGA